MGFVFHSKHLITAMYKGNLTLKQYNGLYDAEQEKLTAEVSSKMSYIKKA